MARMKLHAQKQVGEEEGFIWLTLPHCREVRQELKQGVEKSDRNSKTGTEPGGRN